MTGRRRAWLWLALFAGHGLSASAQPAPAPDAGVAEPAQTPPQEPPPQEPPPQGQPPAAQRPEPAAPESEPAPITALPELVRYVEADYPPRAKAEGVEAEVILQIDVDAQGRVEAVSVATPATPAGYGFDEAAVEAAKQFLFRPAMAGEQPVPVRITYRYRFFLEPPEAPPAQAPATASPPGSAPPAAAPAKEPVVNFSGELLERGTRVPLSGVTVTVFQGSPGAPERAFEAVTGADGRFEFFDLAAGPWNVLIEAPGYFPVRTTETVTAGQRTHVRYYVERGSYNPYDVLVEADRPRREVSRTSLSVAQIERIPGTAGDALSVVQNLPGVARSLPFSGEILVRGAAPEDTQVVLEGMSIPIIYHFGALRSVIPTPMLSGIDFYPGNFGPEYGRAIGGVVDVRLKKLEPERVGAIVDVSLLDANLFVEAPISEHAAIAVAARRSYVDYLLDAAVSDNDDVKLVTAPRYYDMQLLAQARPAPGHELRAFALLSDDEFKLLFENPGEADVRLIGDRLRLGVNFHRTLLDYSFTPSQQFQNTLRLAGGRDQTRFELAQFEFNVQSTSLQLRDIARWSLRDDLAFSVGVDHIFQSLDYRVYLPPPAREGEVVQEGIDAAISSEEEGVELNAFGAFAAMEWQPLERLSLFPGLRFDYYPRIEQSTLAPRLTTRVKLDPQWVAKAGVGLFYQEPPFDETDPVFGNPDLGAEGAVHYSAGVEYRPLPYLLVDVTGFYKTLFDLVAPSDAIVERDGQRVDERVANTGEGRVYGAEVLIRHDSSHNFSGWIAYTLMRSERRDSPEQPLRLFSRDQTHILTALGTYRLPRNWELSVRWRLVSGNPNTPIVGALFNSDLDRYQPIFGAINSDRIPPFHQLDLRVDKRWIWPELQFSIYLDIQNIYNRENPEGVSYSFDYSERELAQGLPILPILGLRAEY